MKTTVKKITAGAFLAILLLTGNTNIKGSEVESQKKIIETTLHVENWMINETVWNTNSFMNYEIVAETESGLELEYWMTSEKTWKMENHFSIETESELKVEKWMINDNVWNKE